MTKQAQVGTVAEASTVYGVSESTIKLWIREGKLPATRVGKRRYEVSLDAPVNDPHVAFTRALQSISDSDAVTLRDFAKRIDTAVNGSAMLFGYAWSALGAQARRTSTQECDA
ncbi:helix-turn-helix domain-containing protein [Microbacterium sp. YY-01]|uniref:helix-turn-helix domain-containing protein n=1 Tax=Microbacterium sp. YY-01 TaxID=3421634 RepID=UPI003D1639C7